MIDPEPVLSAWEIFPYACIPARPAVMPARYIAGHEFTTHPREREICAAVEAQLERDRRRKQFQQMLYGNQSIEKDLSQ